MRQPATIGMVMTLDKYEELAKLYVEERFPYDRRLLELLRLSDFILWLRQRERQSVAAATIADNDGPAEPQRRGRPSRVADIGD